MYQYIMFDLDGTLTNSAEGVTKSVEYALNDQGIVVNDRTDLLCCIGPPLKYSFMNFYGMDEKRAEQAVEKYRERYEDIGIFENEVYDGIIPLLKELKMRGLKIAVATSKPENFAIRILKKYNLYEYFDVVSAADLNSELTKTDVMKNAIHKLGVKHLESVVMVGDRNFDINGARDCDIDSIGVTYGFANEGELSEATYLVDTPMQILEVV